MKLYRYLKEKSLDSNYSNIFTGTLYRAVDSRSGVSALGSGIYFTDDPEAAMRYGKRIEVFQAKNLKYLGYNSREHDAIWRKLKDTFDEDSFAEAIRQEAEKQGYDAIWHGSIFGLVVFPKSMKKIKRVGALNELALKSKDTMIEKEKDTKDSYEVRITIGLPAQKPGGSYESYEFRFLAYKYESAAWEYLTSHEIPEKIKVEPADKIWEIQFVDYMGRIIKRDFADKRIAIRLFAALQEVFTEFVKSKKPDKMVFTAAGKSRIQLYDTIAKRLSKYYKSDSFKHDGEKIFIFQK